MSKFNVGDQVIAQKDAPYYITTDGWKGEVVGIMDQTIQVRGPDLHGIGIDSFWVGAQYFDKADGFTPFGDLTEEQQGALLLAEHNGYTIQCRGHADEDWGDITWVPSWDEETQYRVKPDAAVEYAIVNGAKDNLAEHEAKIKALEEELASLNI